MSRLVWKYALDKVVNEVQAPDSAEWIAAQDRGGRIQAWAIVDTDSPMVTHTLHVVGTGVHRVPTGKHIGTIQQDKYVWHVIVEARDRAVPL